MQKIAELFTLKSAAIRADLDRVADEHNLIKLKSDVEESVLQRLEWRNSTSCFTC
jgi:hypothetical protein